MGVTSAARKSLREDSLVLKNKHEEFLRRISSPSQSPSVSAVTSPAISTLPLPNAHHYYSTSTSQLAPSPNTNDSLHTRFSRRISVSQDDIALLSDQNAELLSKLEKLESDSAQADLASRRKLRKLEAEIQGLREELEQTQVKSEELEEKAKIGSDPEKVAEEIWKKKMEREEKIRVMRGKLESDVGGDRVRDFAPGSAVIPSGSSPNTTPVKPVRSLGDGLLDAPPVFRFPKVPVRSIDHDCQGDVFSSQARSLAPERELAVVSQLLLKIRELEAANAQITDQQAETAVTLHSVQKDAESIRRVYEGLSNTEGVEWEIVVDEDSEKGTDETKAAGNDTIRFRSYRRCLDDATSRPMLSSENDFADGITGNMQSTVNDSALNRIISNHKARKSVVGLFDAPRPSELPSLETTDLPMRFATAADSAHDALLSPALSTLSMAGPFSIHDNRATLGSELGSEFGDEWGVNAGNHHLRNTSLYQLATPSAPSSPIPTSSPVQAAENSGNMSRDLPQPRSSSLCVRSGLQPRDQSLQPGAIGSRLGHQKDRCQRLSQTIRSRTNHWANGRFKESLSSKRPGQPVEVSETQQSLTPTPQGLVDVFDSVVDALAIPGMREVATTAANDDEDMQQTTAMAGSTDANPSGNNAKGVRNVIFELWLWLQFCIIILVFLWAMAKRGPKSVLEEAERRSSTKRYS